MNVCFTMSFLGTDSESQVELERCSQEYTYKEVREAALGRTKSKPSEAQANSTGSSGAGMTLQICPQLKAGFASLHQPVTGCSSAGSSPAAEGNSQWAASHQWPMLPAHLGMVLLIWRKDLERTVQYCLQKGFFIVVSTTKPDFKP